MSKVSALPPGARIGILGGGQLGRMLAMAAARLGFVPMIYDPAADAPAGQVAALHVGAFEDPDALGAFAAAVDVLTYEWENIPLEAVEGLEAPLFPSARALDVAQDRLREKDFLAGLGLGTAPYRAVADARELEAALADLGRPAILKTRRMGYDGKGQVRIAGGDALPDVGTPSILEGMVDFEREISVIVARGRDGAVSCFDPGENLHEGGILRRTTVPAQMPRARVTDAVVIAGRIAQALDYVGVMGVELFVTRAGLLVNEIAPRVHNSGHWTEAACAIDQFEQHIRAITGWPLGDGSRHSDAQMENLLGDEVLRWQDAPAGLHLYGKAEARAGRKMGHVTHITPRSGI